MPGSLEDLPLPVNDEQADPLKELLFDDLGNKAAQPTAENEEVFDLPIRFVEKDKKPNPASQKDSEAPTTAPSVRPASQSSVLPGSPFSGGPPPRKRPS